MILTCLKCGKQFHYALARDASVTCECGLLLTVPRVHDTGVQPSQRLANRMRAKAFRAAGVVSNLGLMALTVALGGVLFPPLGLAAIGFGAWVLATQRGPLGRFAGRRLAMAAVLLGAGELLVGGLLLDNYLAARSGARIAELQESARRDLKVLLQAQRAFFADYNAYGSPEFLHFTPPKGFYTIYLGRHSVIPPAPHGLAQVALPEDIQAGVDATGFTAVAVGNIDADDFLDIWSINHANQLRHLADDVNNQRETLATPAGPDPAFDAASDGQTVTAVPPAAAAAPTASPPDSSPQPGAAGTAPATTAPKTPAPAPTPAPTSTPAPAPGTDPASAVPAPAPTQSAPPMAPTPTPAPGPPTGSPPAAPSTTTSPAPAPSDGGTQR